MAVKFATPKNPEAAEGLDKKDLVDDLIVITLTEYDPEASTKYGSSPAAFCEVVVVDGDHAGEHEEKIAFFGNLGKQIGEGIEVGDTAVGRITSGTSANGNSWYGINWAEEPADFRAAEKAMKPASTSTRGSSKASASQEEPPF